VLQKKDLDVFAKARITILYQTGNIHHRKKLNT